MPDGEQPSLNWLCLYLNEFYQALMTWTGWRCLSAGIWSQTGLNQLPLPVWSRLVSAQGWSDFRRESLRRIMATQTEALDRLQGKGLVFEESLHHMIISYAHQLAFHDRLSQYHVEESLARLDAQAEPYYAMRAMLMCGTMHRTFGRLEKSLEIYDKQQAIAEQVGAHDTPLSPDFARGWTYVGMGKLADAIKSFQRAVTHAQKHTLLYEEARYLNGLGYTLFRQGDYDAALQTFQRAIRVYWDENRDDFISYNLGHKTDTPYMRALCLHNVALVKEYQGGAENLRQALKWEHSALELQRPVDDPGPLCDMLRRAIRLSRKVRNPIALGKHTLALGRLRLRYPIPVFCPPLPERIRSIMKRLVKAPSHETPEELT